MARTEQQYISHLKKLIEKKFSFGNGHGHTQRDLEILSERIEEKTGVIISLSTLKRLWKNDFKQSPQLATLNALTSLLDYKDWQEFKEKNRKEERFSKPLMTGILIGLFIIIITSFIISELSEPNKIRYRQISINGPVEFTAEKTVTSGIPNTVVFKYDVSNVDADTFFIQQSWNEAHRYPIKKEGSAFSNTYYESGYHRARLFANDSVIALQPIHILSNGWEPHIYYDGSQLVPIDFRNERFIENGQLHLKESLLDKKNVDRSKSFYTRISNSQEFKVSSHNFDFITRFKSDTLLNTLCPWATVIIVTDVHIFSVSFLNKGCESYGSYKLGEIVRDASENDMSKLGRDLANWQELRVKVVDKSAEIHINGKKEYTEQFKEDFGNIVGLIYIFEGTGSIDFAKLADGDGNVIFEDDFENEIVQLSTTSSDG